MSFNSLFAMRFSVCITTRNRTSALNSCLCALWQSTVKPYRVIVSDDSPDSQIRQGNYQIVQQYPQATYITGPQAGVCANRNHALRTLLEFEADLIAFIDDDICVESDFIAYALEHYNGLPLEQKTYTILSGVHSHEPISSSPTKLSFRGYFCASNTPESVNLHAAVFPRSLLEIEQWDENIYFGYEDAELCLRALKRNYHIFHCPELQVTDTCIQAGTLKEPGTSVLTEYEIHIESARLYVGIKRYKDIFPNRIKLLGFIVLYFAHMTLYLLRRGYLQGFPEIVRRSRIQTLWQPSIFSKLVVE
jgi:GT2 family glycosyltransferase